MSVVWVPRRSCSLAEGSILTSAIKITVCTKQGPVAQWIRLLSSEPKIAGSSPARLRLLRLNISSAKPAGLQPKPSWSTMNKHSGSLLGLGAPEL